MPIIDYQEIPAANICDGKQDTFELFASEFFKEIHGFRMISEPNRGPDGGKDILFEETVEGTLSKQTIKWLVSCKHKAHSGTTVLESDENNITDRLLQHGAKGFIGFYSTLPSSGLNNRLDSIKTSGIYLVEVFNGERIESDLVRNDKSSIFKRFFPISFKKWEDKTKEEIPTKLYDDDIELKCAICGKDLLQNRKDYIANIIYAKKFHSNECLEVNCVCKGECDFKLEHYYRTIGMGTEWYDLSDYFIPSIYLKKYMAIMNILYEDTKQYSKKAFEQYKQILLAISPYVLREQSEKEYNRARRETEFPF